MAPQDKQLQNKAWSDAWQRHHFGGAAGDEDDVAEEEEEEVEEEEEDDAVLEEGDAGEETFDLVGAAVDENESGENSGADVSNRDAAAFPPFPIRLAPLPSSLPLKFDAILFPPPPPPPPPPLLLL